MSILVPTDVELSRGTIRLHPVDLLPAQETPMIGRHDPNWDLFIQHIPVQFHGLAPPPTQFQVMRHYNWLSLIQTNKLQDFKKPQPFVPLLNQPPPLFSNNLPQNLNMPPPTMSQMPPSQQPSIPISMSSQQPPPAFASQPPPTSSTLDFSQPPPLTQNVELSGGDAAATSSAMVQQQVEMIEQSSQHPNPIPLTSVPPPTMRSVPSSLPSIDMSMPPPIFSGNVSMDQKKQLSPVSGFRNMLKSSFLRQWVQPQVSLCASVHLRCV